MRRVTRPPDSPQSEGRKITASRVRGTFTRSREQQHPQLRTRWASLRRLERSEFGATTPWALDLIVTPDRSRGYSKPRFHAWVTDRSGFNGRAITVPGIIEEISAKW